MKKFFNVISLDGAISFAERLSGVGTEKVPVDEAFGRISSGDVPAPEDLPGFERSTMDGYAVRASSTFGASQGSPAWLTVTDAVVMGKVPSFSVKPGAAAPIPTGAMLPEGSDGVVMVEFTEIVDDETIEVYKSIAPGANIVKKDEDFKKKETVIEQGKLIQPADIGVLAAFGIQDLNVFKKPVVGIVSTGDEVVPIEDSPEPGQIRDVNSHTLSTMVKKAGGCPVLYGIVKDSAETLAAVVAKAVDVSDMVLVSGGSSVGIRDYTLDVFSKLHASNILFHGISLSPGKPTILCMAGEKPVFGLPGHVTSAMVVFEVVVLPFLLKLAGKNSGKEFGRYCKAVLTRNIASAQGRTDFIRVMLEEKDDRIYATPVRGKSGLLNTMVKSDGLVEIPLNKEGLEKNSQVSVRLM